MRGFVTGLLLLAFIGTVQAELQPVDYIIGPQLFCEGDRISINEVKALSGELAVGDLVEVTGRYCLQSHAEGRIGFFVTQMERDGQTKILPAQWFEVSRGEGGFEVSLRIQHAGYLHVSFYPKAGGQAFGGVYFGNDAQMQAIEDWSLEWYLGGALPAERSDEVSALQ